uniref:Uncharacterized protein n=1 Tax=Kalanchoe fedtschenkoi TaxID=63787 RepID=A0A7N0TUN6_KALFE
MSDSRNRGNERFYSPPAARRRQQHLVMHREQREAELMFLQHQQYIHQHHQQQLHLTAMMRLQYEEELRQQRLFLLQQAQLHEQQMMAARRETQVQAAEVEAEDSRSEVVESALSGDSSRITTNIDRLVQTVTPCVQARFQPQPRRNGQELLEAGLNQYYYLDDLWECFREWSAYGAGVELTLNGNENVTQYYVPSLSLIQLYVDPATSRNLGINAISQRMSEMTMAPRTSTSTGESSQSRENLIFEYQEHELPHQRMPLFDKVCPVSHYGASSVFELKIKSSFSKFMPADFSSCF